jgi:hypothetical protein
MMAEAKVDMKPGIERRDKHLWSQMLFNPYNYINSKEEEDEVLTLSSRS